MSKQTLPSDHPWPMFQGNAQRTGQGMGSGARGIKKWSFTSSEQFRMSPVLGSNGIVYASCDGFASCDDARLYALDASRGARIWVFPVPGGLIASPAIGSDGTVYVASVLGCVYALDPENGRLKWKFSSFDVLTEYPFKEHQLRIFSSPLPGSDDTIYIAVTTITPTLMGGFLCALSASTGKCKWISSIGNPQMCSPSIGHDGTVYIGGQIPKPDWPENDYYLYALDGMTGAQKWRIETNDLVVIDVCVGSDGSVYFGTWDGCVFAVDGASRIQRWVFKAGERLSSGPALDSQGTLYFGSIDHCVYALDAQTGAQRWVSDLGDKITSSPAIAADGAVYIGRWGKLYALSGATGAVLWSFRCTPWIQGKLRYTSMIEKLRTIAELIREPEKLEPWVYSPAIGADGTIYVTDVHRLYAIG